MKKTIILILAILLLCTTVFATVYQTPLAFGGRIKFTLLNQDPDPVKPGEYVELRWTIENYGTDASGELFVEIVPEYPFSLRPGDTKITSIGSLTGRQMGEEAYVFYKKLKIDEKAVEGENTIKLRYKYGKNGYWVELEEFTIRIQTIDAAISIDSINSKKFVPGNTGKLSINIKNLADSVMKDITFKLDLTLSTIVSNSAIANPLTAFDTIPFAPSNSATEKRIQKLNAGETKTIEYTLAAFPEAESGIYKIPITLTYKDELETEYTKNDIIGLTVGADPDIYIVIEDSDILAGKKNGKVTFKIVNKGVTNVKFADLILKETNDYEITSSAEEYIGNIDTDDYENIYFKLLLKNNNNGKQKSSMNFPLLLTFKDANNNDFKKEFNLTYQIYTAEQKGQAKSQSAIIIIAVIIVMIIAWVVYKKWEKRRKQKNKKK